MNFIKFLRSFKVKNRLPKNHSVFIFLTRPIGQISVEYVILTVVLVGVLSVWLAGSLPRLGEDLRTNFFDKAVERIVTDPYDGGGNSGGNGGGHPDDPDDPEDPLVI
jgi:hypothetical protein